jgi:hypothetical protein
MSSDIVNLPISTIEEMEEKFIDKYMLNKDMFDNAINFINTHFTREFQS